LISSIGIDHVDWLGATRSSIAQEKAGVFRANTPAIIGDCEPPLSLVQCALDKKAHLFCINKEFHYQKQITTWDWFSKNTHISDLPEPGLKGEHQYRNASAAILAVELLAKKLPVSHESIRFGLKNSQLLGRFQLINDKIPVLLDVGHNPEAVKTLLDYLLMTFPGKRIRAVFSMMKDKDIATVLEIMNPVVYDWFFVPLANPRAATETMMRDFFSRSSVNRVSFGYTGFAQAFNAVKNQAQQDDLLLVLISDCLNEFEKCELKK
jgi:dihydrofolate synthase/folylpolyglutamate synthase